MLSLPTSLLNLRRFKLRSGIANQELGWSTAFIWESVDSSVKHPLSSQPEAMLAATKAGVCPIADTFVPLESVVSPDTTGTTALELSPK
jgi:hypothetical protein